MKVSDKIAENHRLPPSPSPSQKKALLPIRQILVPIDWGELSDRAFQLAVSLARQHDAELVVLNVVPLAASMYGPPPENYLDHLHEELSCKKPCDPEIRAKYLVAEGDPAAAILRVARETHSDLIVMGTHGRAGLNRLLMGSVAEEVVRRAPCLVLTVNDAVPASLIGFQKDASVNLSPGQGFVTG